MSFQIVPSIWSLNLAAQTITLKYTDIQSYYARLSDGKQIRNSKLPTLQKILCTTSEP